MEKDLLTFIGEESLASMWRGVFGWNDRRKGVCRRVRFSCLFAVIVAAALLVLGCDPGWKLTANVTVPADQQEQFDAHPAQVLLRTEKLADREDSAVKPNWSEPSPVGIICEPTSKQIEFDYSASEVGCSIRTRVEAWLAPVELEAGESCEELKARVEKGEYDVSRLQGMRPSDGQPQAKVVAFPDHDTAQCRGSKDHVELSLESNN